MLRAVPFESTGQSEHSFVAQHLGRPSTAREGRTVGTGTTCWEPKIVAQARSENPSRLVEVEVDTLEQLREVLKVDGLQVVLLDNMDCPQMERAIDLLRLADGEVDREHGVPVARVADSRRAMHAVSRRFFGDPGSALELVGVTGTNGKTSTVRMLESVLRAAENAMAMAIVSATCSS